MNILKYNWTDEIDQRITELALDAMENSKPFITAFRTVSEETGIPTPNVSNRWNLKLKKNYENRVTEYKKKKSQVKIEKKNQLINVNRTSSDVNVESVEIIKLLQNEISHLRRELIKAEKDNEQLKSELTKLRQLDHIAGLLRVMKKL